MERSHQNSKGKFVICHVVGRLNDESKKLTTENFLSRNPHEFDIESLDSTKESDDDIDDVEGGIVETIHIKIPNEENERICANCCAICLDAYKVDDVVVWSSSPDCRHVFHQECLVEGLSRAQGNDAPCPCCRKVFCDIRMQQGRQCPLRSFREH